MPPMNMDFKRKLPTPKEIKEMYPLSDELLALKEQNDIEIQDIFLGKSDKLALVIGPCSADREDAVLDYISRLRKVQEIVKEKVIIIPRIYTNKPRTTGDWFNSLIFHFKQYFSLYFLSTKFSLSTGYLKQYSPVIPVTTVIRTTIFKRSNGKGKNNGSE